MRESVRIAEAGNPILKASPLIKRQSDEEETIQGAEKRGDASSSASALQPSSFKLRLQASILTHCAISSSTTTIT